MGLREFEFRNYDWNLNLEKESTGWLSFVESLFTASKRNLKSLTLTNCKIMDSTAALCLGPIVLELETLILNHADLTCSTLSATTDKFSQWPPHCPEYRKQSQDHHVVYLCEDSWLGWLSISNNLSTLDLSNNSLQGEGAQALALIIKNGLANLQTLNLDRNGVNDGLEHLLDALTNNSSVTSLSVAQNYAHSEAGFMLAKVLTSNSTLRSVDYSLNRLDSGALKAVALALAFNSSSSLIELSINSTTPQGEDINWFVKMLECNSTLAIIQMRSNNIRSEEWPAFARLIEVTNMN